MSKNGLIRLIFIFILLVGNIIAIYFIRTTDHKTYYVIALVIILSALYFLNEDEVKKNQNRIFWLEDKLSQMNQITYQAKRAGEISLNEFPVGVFIFDDFYEIKWSNNFVLKLFGSSMIGKKLNSLSEEIIRNVEESNSNFIIEIGNKTISFEYNQEFSVLYFFDITENVNLNKRYLSKRLTLGYLALDNLDETLANLDVQERTTIQGKYFSKVGEWADEYDIYLKALSSEKFQLLMDYSQLKDIIEDDFSILSEIRRISNENHYQITGSLGIACWDENYVELGDRVNEALDIAFDRGGDQAVVNIQGQPIRYFGGVSETVEKRSRVKARMVSGQLLELINQSENVLVMSHIQPDHDALGAMVGIIKLAEYLGKEIKVVIDGDNIDVAVEKLLSRLLEEDERMNNIFVSKDQAKQSITTDTLIVIVDTNNPAIIYSSELLNNNCKRVIIDHHRRGKDMIERAELIYIEPYASSSVELIVELMQFYESELNISSTEATLMYIGIVVDTNNFSYRTGSRTFDAASFLRLYGANLTKVKMYLREDYNDYMTQSRLLSDAEVYLRRFGLIVTDEILSRVSLAKLSDRLLMIDNIDASFVIGKLSEDVVGITARSFGDVNVQVLMEKFNGGGHLHSAAAQIEMQVDECYEALRDLLDELGEGD
ncbi:DHH family phosphoesterase [Mycoplasmatota bacterium]|nr:DHH family phosphoesterase [Mycoplasmatota bacterium]